MRILAALVLGFGLTAAASQTQAFPSLTSPAPAASGPAVTKVEYFCSPGYVPTYGGRCVATPANDQIDLYLNDTVDERVVTHHYHHRRHGLRAKY